MELKLTLEPKLEAVLREHCKIHQTTPEEAVMRILRNRFLPFEPRNEEDVHLLAMGLDSGVSLPDSAFLAEELYD